MSGLKSKFGRHAAVATFAAVALTGMTVLGAADAKARGFLSGIADQFLPGAGDVLDGLNDSLHRPVDRGSVIILDGIFPGSGPVLEELWDLD